MTVTLIDPVRVHPGNGVTVDFATPYFAAPADLAVTHVSGAGVETVLVLGTHYTLAGQDDPDGGTLTIVDLTYRPDQPSDGSRLVIESAAEATQERSFPSSGPLPAKEIEAALDKQAVVAQQLLAALALTLRAPAGETVPRLPRASARANKVLAFDGTGAPSLTDPATGGGGVVLPIAQSDVSGLVAALAAKAALAHAHAIGDVTELQGALDAAAGGSTILNGAGPPDPGAGIDGNYYFDTTARDFYQKSAGAWAFLAALAGLEGAAGRGFVIDAVGLKASRTVHDAEDQGFTYFATDTGEVSFKLSNAVADWSDWVQFTGEAGVSATFTFDAIDTFANRSLHDNEAQGFSFLASDTFDAYFKLSATPADWSDAIPFRGPAGPSTDQVLIEYKSTDHTLVVGDLGKLLVFTGSQNRSLFVPEALKTELDRVWPFAVMHIGSGQVSVLPSTGSGGAAEPTVAASGQYQEAKLTQTPPNGGEENGGSFTIPTGLTDRYLVVGVTATTAIGDGMPSATATFGGTPMTLIGVSPAFVEQQSIRAWLFGLANPPEGAATLSVAFTQAGQTASTIKILSSAVAPVLLAGVDQASPFTGVASDEVPASTASLLDLTLDGVIPANSLLVGMAGMVRGSAVAVGTVSTYLQQGNCGTTSDLSQRWMLASESGGVEGAGKTINWDWDLSRQIAGVGAAFKPAAAGGAVILAAAGEVAKTRGQYARLSCLYSAYDDGGTKYRVFTEGGPSA